MTPDKNLAVILQDPTDGERSKLEKGICTCLGKCVDKRGRIRPI
jgi:hypothetical protein